MSARACNASPPHATPPRVRHHAALDITGGAGTRWPSSAPSSSRARERGINVIDRCNLTVLYARRKKEDLPRFLADNGVQVVASLREAARPTQARSVAGGAGCFSAPAGAPRSQRCIDAAWRAWMSVGSIGCTIRGVRFASSEAALTEAYRSAELAASCARASFASHHVHRTCPLSVSRGLSAQGGKDGGGRRPHVESFNPAAAEGVMCRDYWCRCRGDGRLFDCDFNQQLDMPCRARAAGSPCTTSSRWTNSRAETGGG